ncbi:GPO family capsid scaffolding protein [Acinetobacter bereziniae]|uniref:GPO family capsid scaffolding protein n=1 Tax=Acinetobacter bereziniae TaxID=106648 RepID=UPI00148FAFA8|nr:GPO family capsid scaffolding protein [Acinetobacter bereziniae]
MSQKSKFFRVATEGNTIDGRKIERSWLEDIAQTYNVDTYGARIWVEHLRSLMPDSVFGAYGDVVAVKTEEVEINGEKKLALFAQIEATPQLIELNKKSQKVFTSIEVNPNFANTGKAYLEGMAVTDTPASLGTEKLQFNSMAMTFGNNAKTNLFSVALETQLEFEDDSKNIFAGMLQKFSDLFAPEIEKQGTEAKVNFTEVKKVLDQIAETFGKQSTAFANLQKELDELKLKYNGLEQNHNTLSEAFNKQPHPNHHKRPESTGNQGSTTAVSY